MHSLPRSKEIKKREPRFRPQVVVVGDPNKSRLMDLVVRKVLELEEQDNLRRMDPDLKEGA